jgi:hypothetical protein
MREISMRCFTFVTLFIATTALLPSQARAQFSNWKVVVAGGPHAGTYTIPSGLPCSKNNPTKGMLATGFDRFVDTASAVTRAAAFKALKDPNAINWMQLYADGGGSGTGKLAVYFGPVDGERGPRHSPGTMYDVETRSGRKAKGSGTFAVKSQGGGAAITFNGTSAQGVKLQVTATCSMIF